MPSVINGLSRTLLLRGKSKSINSFVSEGLYVYTLVMFMRYIWVYSITIHGFTISFPFRKLHSFY